MRGTTLSGEAFDQAPERAKTLAAQGPVFVTENGKPADVLLGIEEYRRLAPKRRTMLEAMTGPVLPDTDLALPLFDDLPRLLPTRTDALSCSPWRFRVATGARDRTLLSGDNRLPH